MVHRSFLNVLLAATTFSLFQVSSRPFFRDLPDFSDLLTQTKGNIELQNTFLAQEDSSEGSVEKVLELWGQYLEQPPQEAVTLASQLSYEADTLVAKLLSSSDPLNLAGELDVVCSGGGNYDAFYMGIDMILSRVSSKTKAFKRIRYAGASAGGMMPFEIALKTQNATLISHLSYGVLSAQFPELYGTLASASFMEAQSWRQMAIWQTQQYSTVLGDLNGTVYLALSCLTPFPSLVTVKNYTAIGDQATHAFVATGSMMEPYDGMMCSDGGSTSGADMTPLFQDRQRPQLIVNLMKTGFPSDMIFQIKTDQWYQLVQYGQSQAIQFLQTGKSSSGSITLCPLGANVASNVCKT
eukprot:gb/GEZN01009169.1/.p1 GENE.gb/GEZN01009169.1/~~gb/GEZN01009169.1/.p1  ORF type:complete len:353 (-),score=40.68 gb/GEZN01009169.1/:220-1278(-)